MKDIRCLLGFHDWKRVSDKTPIIQYREFDSTLFVGIFALGECRRAGCAVLEPRRCGGSNTWQSFDETTMEDAIPEWMTQRERRKDWG